jgi:hypothetical protein
LFFGRDGHFGDITKLAIQDPKKKEKKRKKNHLTGVVSHPTKVRISTRTWLHMDENVEHES